MNIKPVIIMVVAVLFGFSVPCRAENGNAQLGDVGKCGRDCIYYVCHQFGQQDTLDNIDHQLQGRKDITFHTIRKQFETRGWHCQSFVFNAANISTLQTNFDKHKKQLCAIAALPTTSESDNHFVVVIKSTGSFLTILDVSNNRTGTLNLADYKGKSISIPVLVVATHPFRYTATSPIQLSELYMGIGIIIVLCVFFILARRFYG